MMKSDKGKEFKVTCAGIIEATPDFIMYDIVEDNGYHARYVERYQNVHLIKHDEYDAVVGKKTAKKVGRSYYLVDEIYISSINDDSIKDRLMYRVIRKFL